MKAIYKDKVYVVNRDETMTPIGGDTPIPIPYGSEDLIIDPTDSELGWVEYLDSRENKEDT